MTRVMNWMLMHSRVMTTRLTAAADYDVRLHYAPFRADSSKLFRVHTGRVKDIGTSWGMPQVFWSVAEDGVVFQFDVRALPTTTGRGETAGGASGAIVRLGRDQRGKLLRGMGMATHPLDPTKFALACGDYYTRLYDHRMLRLLPPQQQASRMTTSLDATVPVEVFAPPHLHLNKFSDRSAQYRHEEAHGTSIQFSSDGAQILANYHNDHIYLFGVHGGPNPVTTFEKPNDYDERGWEHGAQMDETIRPLPMRAADVKELHSKGLVALVGRNFVRALKAFTTACSASSLPSLTPSFRKDLYHNCAKAYLGRAWSGDFYLAAVYCKRALEIDEASREVNLTYIKALYADKRTMHSRALAQLYQLRYPEFVSDVRRYLQFNQSQGHQYDESDDESEEDDERASASTMSGIGSPEEESAEDDDVDDEEENADESADDDDEDGRADDDSDGVGDGSNHEDDTPPGSPSYMASQRDASFWDSKEVNGKQVNYDVVRRYIGYCNSETDIKEAAFFGGNDAFIVAGSDDGRAYFWNKVTGKLVNTIVADETILNCVRPHPFDSCIATSGIEDVIRLWSPTGGDDLVPPTEDELDEMVQANQTKMANDSWGFYVGGADQNMVRVVFQAAAGQGGAQECTTH